MQRFLLTALAASVFATAHAGLAFGPSVGVFQPLDKKTRDTFGSKWFSFGISPTDIKTATKGQNLDSDIQILSHSQYGNRFTMIALTYGPTFNFVQGPGHSISPYAALRIGPAYYDYAFGSGVNRISKKRVGLDFNAELGANLTNAARLSLRYDKMSQYNGLKFDGLSLNLIFSIGRL